ncbi:Rieske (2Fe-2S) protein [Frankia sp. AgB1.9]|uniref:Rieske (2Fe-2S) protein n=1 Tax=unclassified Frankia TaxID=2632575 RepID=UPI001932B94A|nr:MULTISPECIES: Rieske (2Fe-2S) protein [unclassified Frankia]MBL7487248.1 Rieske (2Fe-2S) protein [Frankia sp. AgW1.1]MBL7547392.1 Rieske (2Fe-2S) protein [Frankia sp. AgB1.9]MBL7618700.1 Rieske (2Fe-2S) protein [Frankia sp. AgB1.8]
MTQDVSTPDGAGSLTRRAIPAAVVVVGAAAGVGVAWNHRDGAGPGANAAGGSPAGGAAAASTPLASLDQIPAGGGLILDKAAVVLTKDQAGDVHAFSAVCTHQGCTVSEVAGGTINCPCHGSKFDVTTGAPVAGPASTPLPPVKVSVHDNAVFPA